jgi:Rha family phage regulatory protein
MTTLSTAIATAKPNDLVFTSNTHQLVTDSVKVAAYFGKLHKDVLRKFKTLGCSSEFNERNFTLVHYDDTKGEIRPMYQMTKNGFMFLVMGFTGKRAAEIKERYIQAFDEMAEQLAKGSRIQPPAQMNTLTLPDFYSVRVLLCIENGEIVGKRMLDSDELIMSRKRFISYFKEPDIGFNDIDQLIELSNSVNERIRVQVRNIQ